MGITVSSRSGVVNQCRLDVNGEAVNGFLETLDPIRMRLSKRNRDVDTRNVICFCLDSDWIRSGPAPPKTMSSGERPVGALNTSVL